MTERDAYGHPRSGRSVATGPGSRGGLYLVDPEFRRQWHRDWYATHPEYRKREVERHRQRRAEYVRRRDEGMPSFVHVLRLMAWEEAQLTSMYALARRMGLDHTTLWRFCRSTHSPSGDTIDAVLAYFEVHQVYREVLFYRAVARERAAEAAKTRPPKRVGRPRKVVRSAQARDSGEWVRRTSPTGLWHKPRVVMVDGVRLRCGITMDLVVSGYGLEYGEPPDPSMRCEQCLAAPARGTSPRRGLRYRRERAARDGDPSG